MSLPCSLLPISQSLTEQGRTHGNTVADGWAGAVMQKKKKKTLGIQKCYGGTTRQGHPRCRVACPRFNITSPPEKIVAKASDGQRYLCPAWVGYDWGLALFAGSGPDWPALICLCVLHSTFLSETILMMALYVIIHKLLNCKTEWYWILDNE